MPLSSWQITLGDKTYTSIELPEKLEFPDTADGSVTFKYRSVFEVEKPQALYLDLGKVRGSVSARINGNPVSFPGFAPHLADLSDVIKVGSNELEITILPPQRNAQVASSNPKFKAMKQFANANAVVGLLGPVTFRQPVE